MNYVEVKDLKEGKCYALITGSGVLEVIKILEINQSSVKVQSMHLRPYAFGHFEEYTIYYYYILQGYVEIPEEEYQKFYHLWKMYSTALIRTHNALQKKMSTNFTESCS